MPGIESGPSQSVAAGAAAQPLVTSAQPVVTPNAVAALADAMRNGVMNAQDIIDRIGPLGQSKRKAELTLANEVSGTTATEARKKTMEAAAARGSLETAQATAAEPLVQPQANLQASTIARQQADQTWGGGVTAYQQYAPFFGKPAIINDPNGAPDYNAMGQEGNRYMRVMAQQNFARMVLEPDPARKVTGVNAQQQPTEKWFNKWGQDITPHPGNPTYTHYQNILNQTNQEIFGNPGQATTTPGATPPAAPQAAAPQAPATPVVQPNNPDALNQLAESGKYSGSQLATMSDTDRQSAAASLFSAAPGTASSAAPAAPAAPVVEPNAPSAAPAIGTYDPSAGLTTGPSKNVSTAKDIGDELRKQKSYELWDQQKGFAHSFETTADKINAVPVDQQRSGKVPMNALDIALAESIIKMYDPGMAIREFKWDKLAEAQPYLEKLPNWKSEFLHTGALTPEGRQRLIEMGYDNIQGKDAAVKPHLELAVTKAKQAGLAPEQILNTDELRVINGQAFGKPPTGSTPGATGAPASTGKVITIPGLGTGTFDPRTGIFTVTK